LRDAGAILIGKLTLEEFGIGSPSDVLPWPAARNPWDIECTPGGSSSGCGVALAACHVPLAIGTDTAGSVRNPAAMCGVVALKPTYDLISRQGVFPLAQSLDHIGLMARTANDCALLLDVLHRAFCIGFSSDGLPIGAQSIGRRFQETKLLAVAAAYQGATRWHLQHPSVPFARPCGFASGDANFASSPS
jgi:aspartyl-tRNA(Asn)/glutamyl-tRNA(Gln) amidotransferase subunit A